MKYRDRLQEASIRKRNELAANLTIEFSFNNLGKLDMLNDVKFWFYFLITPILYGLLIPLFDHIYTKLAKKMNNWENHKTESSYQTHLILKVFPFRFVHVFATLYYYAFSAGSNLLRVAIQLAAFMLSGQMWNNVVKTGLPLITRKYMTHKKRQATTELIKKSPMFNVDTKGQVVDMKNNAAMNNVIQQQCVRLEQASSQVWEVSSQHKFCYCIKFSPLDVHQECQLGKYDTFQDYTEMLIQFGYVSFFYIAFPLAPLLDLINNLISLRADAFKLCHTKQRPIAHKASDIGIW